MRHQNKINHLGRKSAHRKAMLSNMAVSLILHKRITTTIAKAKSLRTFIEPLITRAKEDSTHSRRVVFSYLQSNEGVTELFREVSKKIADRPGGYTRILKTGRRAGDNADMCIIELVDYNEVMLKPKEEAKAKTTRRRKVTTTKKTGKKEETPKASVKEETPAEEPVQEEAVEKDPETSEPTEENK